MTNISSHIFDSSDLPAPEELDEAIEAMEDFTLRTIMQICTLGVSLAKKYPDSRRSIAHTLRNLMDDYDIQGDDDDLYRLRYGRLIPQIEKQLDVLHTYPSDDIVNEKTLDQHWTSLAWLVEDQQKIIS